MPNSVSSKRLYLLAHEHSVGKETLTLWKLPVELQINILTYLRAYDLSTMQRTCRHFSNPVLVDAIVRHTAEYVYPASLTVGFDQQPLTCSSNTSVDNSSSTLYKKVGLEEGIALSQHCTYYTFEHLRNMELIVIARVLSRPEPPTGYIVSKSWCKAALRWLEEKQEQAVEKAAAVANAKQKKLSKKKQRIKNRRSRVNSDAAAPWPNVNSDLVCEHSRLQRCSNTKSARARRRILDKSAWKILKQFYPDSHELDTSQGECWQCLLEVESEQRAQDHRIEQLKLERKRPLSNSHVRQFYTRTRGVPTHALKQNLAAYHDRIFKGDEIYEDLRELCLSSKDKGHKSDVSTQATSAKNSDNGIQCNNDDDDDTSEDYKKQSSSSSNARFSVAFCPLQDGLYYVLPRAWCHGWRRFIKTGDMSDGNLYHPSNGNSNAINYLNSSIIQKTHYYAPDAASLLCDAHRLPLIPPHLQCYLSGQANQLLESIESSDDKSNICCNRYTEPSVAISNADSLVAVSPSVASPLTLAHNSNGGSASALIPGQGPDAESIQALRAAGMSTSQVGAQMAAMLNLERQRLQQEEDMHHNINRYLIELDESSNSLEPPAAAENNRNNSSTMNSKQKNDALDRENHSVVEILTQFEFQALKACWPPATATCLFCLSFRVQSSSNGNKPTTTVTFCTEPCRECDATGRKCAVSIKNRARSWVRKSSEKSRAPASLEY